MKELSARDADVLIREARAWLTQAGIHTEAEADGLSGKRVVIVTNRAYEGGWVAFERDNAALLPMPIGARLEFRESVGSDGYVVTRWFREINGHGYSFVRVEDGNRNAYIDVVRDEVQDGREVSVTVHTFKGRATGPKRGVQVISERLGRLIRF